MSILSGPAIKDAIDKGHIYIEPFDRRQLNPGSYDVRLGPQLREYVPGPVSLPTIAPQLILDAKKDNPTRAFTIPNEGFCMCAMAGYLGHTVERIWSDRYVPILDGKSSTARLFLSIHETAGFGETGFSGQFTLEMTCLYPTRIYAGMRIGQIRFETVEGPIEQYQGHYRGEASTGAVASRSWMQFEED